MNKFLILALLFLTACSTKPVIQTKTVIQFPTIIHPAPPLQPSIVDFDIIVANREELQKLIDENADFAYFILTAENYEVVIKNFNELKRYIENQQQIILYYRKILKEEDNGPS